MENWKEQIERSGFTSSALINKQLITPEILIAFIETEIIEKLIEELRQISDDFRHMQSPDHDIEGEEYTYGWNDALQTADKQLRAKWLGKDNIIAGVDFTESLNQLNDLGKEQNV